jgi:hypothetical protein
VVIALIPVVIAPAKVAPVIVAQEGKKLVLYEYAPERPAARSARP